MSENYIDQAPFLSDRFDVHAYANAVLAGQAYRPDDEPVQNGEASTVKAGTASTGSGKGDIGMELAKLNHGIEDVTKHLRQEISTSYPLLLAHLTASLALSSHIQPIRTSLTSLSSSLDRLNTKIHTPYETLSLLVQRQKLVAQASDLTRRAARFVLVAKRMEGQMERMNAATADKIGEGEKERALAKAALSVAELDSLLHPPPAEEAGGMAHGLEPIPLGQLDFVKAFAPKVDAARDTIIQEMEGMVINGLSDLNQPLLSSSLQTAHNLRLLPDLVSNLLADLNDAVTLRITRAFDSAAIGKERVIEDVANCCIKVYTLEKVLKLKKDAETHVEFLEVVMKTLDERPSFTFWTTLAKALETQTKDVAKTSAWLQQALSTGYPRLLRIFHDFFSKIAMHTETVYTRDQQSPEAVLVLRSISTFETLYLSKSTTRMNETVSGALASYLSARGSPPGPGAGVTVARTITNELDSARFDPLLVRTVARNAVKVLEGMIAKVDGMLVNDYTAVSLIGPNATPAQVINCQLVGFLYHCWYNLLFIETEFPAKVWEIMSPTISSIKATYTKITDALDTALKREFASISSRIHKVDFGKPMDPMSMGSGGGSPYMQDLIDKLSFVKMELLGKMSMGEAMRAWVLALAGYIIRTFLLHASIARPLGESGKLKLTTDMTELEVGLSSLLTTGQVQGQRGGMKLERIGDDYLALRAFRQILFSPVSSLTNAVETVHLPPLITLHHIIVLSPLRLPHELHGWTEQEYFLWVQKHADEKEQWDLLEKAVDDQIDGTSSGKVKGKEPEEGDEEEKKFVRIVKEVLEHARHRDE
ncbi:Golgi transport complex subunit 5-domain-containing protein [Dioszegia hungarica]|uniref:Conserved oligomeric Golgi complex subunit 5 n=1 Tax=Dioszegia hungarica TaxID=4972 RepID=A0AA38H7K3_9TREE|nr:Golgi transport complex subunit 5-domain-containing protein [Dioszegia hungarica]KAI9635240.1 Golgi transport complex subunit 5-domain-containing protein [Dioszegia hungarica]